MVGVAGPEGPDANLASLLARHIDRMSMANTSGKMSVGELARQMMLLDAQAYAILCDHERFQKEKQAAWDAELPRDMPQSAKESARWYRVLGITMKWLYRENVLRRAPADWEDLADF